MSITSSEDQLASNGKRLWKDPAFELERTLVARAQQFGPNGTGAEGPSFGSLISPFGASSDPQACP